MISAAIDAALRDRNLLGGALGDPSSWAVWLATLKAAFGRPLNDADRSYFHAVAGDRPPPSRRVRELWAIVGRRSGKTRMAAAISVHIATLETHKLAAGEVGYVLLIAASRAQASVAFGYVLGFLEESPILRRQIESTTADEVRLRNRVRIAVHAGSFRTIRGRTLLAVVGDETAFWRDEASAQPDVEIFRACAPSLAAHNGLWVGISTPYRRNGLLFERWRDYYGVDGDDVLVVQGESRTFNLTLSEAMIATASAADPEGAVSEWQGGFRTDIAAFLSDQDIEACVDRDRPLELPFRSDVRRYHAFCDPSGGRHDAMTMVIAHMDGDTVIVDAIRAHKPPFDPQTVASEFATLAREYRISEIIGDNYSGEWVVTSFRDAGIHYKRSEYAKSVLYLEGLPIFVRHMVRLPDHPRLLRELRLLERRTHAGGKDSVDHGRTGSDDLANSLFGAIWCAKHPPQRIRWGVCQGADGFGRIVWKDEEPQRARIKLVVIPEKDAPASKGWF